MSSDIRRSGPPVHSPVYTHLGANRPEEQSPHDETLHNLAQNLPSGVGPGQYGFAAMSMTVQEQLKMFAGSARPTLTEHAEKHADAGRPAYELIERNKAYNDVERNKAYNDVEENKAYNDVEENKAYNDVEKYKAYNLHKLDEQE